MGSGNATLLASSRTIPDVDGGRSKGVRSFFENAGYVSVQGLGLLANHKILGCATGHVGREPNRDGES